MKLSYFRDTDTLFIALSERASTESDEVRDGIVLDYDAGGNVVGIEIESASLMVQNVRSTREDAEATELWLQ